MADYVKILLADGPCLGQWVKVFPTQRVGMPEDLYVCRPNAVTEAGIQYHHYQRIGDGHSMRYEYRRDRMMWFNADGSVRSMR